MSDRAAIYLALNEKGRVTRETIITRFRIERMLERDPTLWRLYATKKETP